MQISSASLLAAQQAKPQTPARPPAARPNEEDQFEPLLFATKPDVTKSTVAAAQPQASPMPFARLGSQIDIKI